MIYFVFYSIYLFFCLLYSLITAIKYKRFEGDRLAEAVRANEIPTNSDYMHGRMSLYVLMFYAEILVFDEFPFVLIHFLVICGMIFLDILRYKYIYRLSWGRLLEKVFRWINKQQEKSLTKIYTQKQKVISIVVMIGLLAIFSSIIYFTKNVFYALFVFMFLWWLLNKVTSRTSYIQMFLFWLANSLTASTLFYLFLGKIDNIRDYIGESFQPVIKFIYKEPMWFFIIFILVVAFFWTWAALMSDDDASRLALILVNTITTIVLAVSQMFVSYHTVFIGDDPGYWNTLQFIILYLLLPFIASGYIALAFKELQMFYKKKTSPTKDR